MTDPLCKFRFTQLIMKRFISDKLLFAETHAIELSMEIGNGVAIAFTECGNQA